MRMEEEAASQEKEESKSETVFSGVSGELRVGGGSDQYGPDLEERFHVRSPAGTRVRVRFKARSARMIATFDFPPESKENRNRVGKQTPKPRRKQIENGASLSPQKEFSEKSSRRLSSGLKKPNLSVQTLVRKSAAERDLTSSFFFLRCIFDLLLCMRRQKENGGWRRLHLHRSLLASCKKFQRITPHSAKSIPHNEDIQSSLFDFLCSFSTWSQALAACWTAWRCPPSPWSPATAVPTAVPTAAANPRSPPTAASSRAGSSWKGK